MGTLALECKYGAGILLVKFQEAFLNPAAGQPQSDTHSLACNPTAVVLWGSRRERSEKLMRSSEKLISRATEIGVGGQWKLEVTGKV